MPTLPQRGEKTFNITPADSSPLILRGKIVPMDGRVINDGAVYCRRGKIEFVQSAAAPAPAGYETATKLDTQGVIYPGLIDLHSHLGHNVLPLWRPLKAYENRHEWQAEREYERDVQQPIRKIKKKFSPQIIRYVEAKLLVGGTTSAQGMSLEQGPKEFYPGMVRNFEDPRDASYPKIETEISDWSPAKDAKIRTSIESGRQFFHHLAEGRDSLSRAVYATVWEKGFIRSNYVGIHCTGLRDGDYAEFAGKKAKAVWSPMSNLLLYGQTLDVPRFLASGVRWGLGSDWSPSGSKNLLGEMKIARLAAQAAEVDLDYETLAKAATVHAAEVVGWNKAGRIAAGCGADFLVLKRASGKDPYENLVRATERDIVLVAIEGIPRYGDEALMRRSGIPAEKLEPYAVAGRKRLFYFEHPDAPAVMNQLSLGKAIATLESVMSKLNGPWPEDLGAELKFVAEKLELDLDMDSPATAFATENPKAFVARDPLPPLDSVALSKLTAVDDPGFFDAIEAIPERPSYLAELRKFYA